MAISKIETASLDTGLVAPTATALTTASGSAPSYSARAWIFFTVSSGTPSISASGNISSITDNGVGDFTFNFTNNFSDTNYCVTSMGTGGGANYQIFGGNQTAYTKNVSSLRGTFGYVSSVGGGLTNQDPASANIAIFR